MLQDKKILLLKRLKDPYKDYWEVPAGKVDGLEDFAETVIREVEEETGLIVKPEKEIGVNINRENKFESHMFLAKVIGGELVNKEQDKHSDIKFFNLSELPDKLGSTTQKGLLILK